jgi:hypothetical protein
MAQIKFGTSGWRAIIADEFTFDNVELVTAAVVQYLQQGNRRGKLMVGYDARFQADRFAWQCTIEPDRWAQMIFEDQAWILLRLSGPGPSGGRRPPVCVSGINTGAALSKCRQIGHCRVRCLFQRSQFS